VAPTGEPPDWLGVVADAYAAGVDRWADGSVTVCRVAGGGNNALYRVEVDGRVYACKLCVADERRRAAREYGALGLLREAGLDVAPEPLWLDESCTALPYPTVVYAWLAGEPLNPALTHGQLAAVSDSVQQMHALRPCDYERFDLRAACLQWFDSAPYLARLRDMLNQYGPWLRTTAPDGQDLWERLARLVERCAVTFATTSVDPGRGRFPLGLCRADQNLANGIWGADGRLRWVDWEYSGWGDPALDLAELRWHAALADLAPAQHAWLRDHYRRPAGDATFNERLAVWDRFVVTHWPFLVLRRLWSEFNGPDRVRLSQLEGEPAALRARLVRFIERAEQVAAGGMVDGR